MDMQGVVLLFLRALALLFIARKVARRAGLVDKQNARKHHNWSIPLVGAVYQVVYHCLPGRGCCNAPGLSIALPLEDMLHMMAGRIHKRCSPFNPDREHLQHILLRRGFDNKNILTLSSVMMTVLSEIDVMYNY